MSNVRRPIAAMPWHGDDTGVMVVCDDGSLWRWSEGGTWERRGAVPGSAAEPYGLTGELPTDVESRMAETENL